MLHKISAINVTLSVNVTSLEIRAEIFQIWTNLQSQSLSSFLVWCYTWWRRCQRWWWWWRWRWWWWWWCLNLSPLVKLLIGPDSDNDWRAKICIIHVLRNPSWTLSWSLTTVDMTLSFLKLGNIIKCHLTCFDQNDRKPPKPSQIPHLKLIWENPPQIRNTYLEWLPPSWLSPELPRRQALPASPRQLSIFAPSIIFDHSSPSSLSSSSSPQDHRTLPSSSLFSFSSFPPPWKPSRWQLWEKRQWDNVQLCENPNSTNQTGSPPNLLACVSSIGNMIILWRNIWVENFGNLEEMPYLISLNLLHYKKVGFISTTFWCG